MNKVGNMSVSVAEMKMKTVSFERHWQSRSPLANVRVLFDQTSCVPVNLDRDDLSWHYSAEAE